MQLSVYHSRAKTKTVNMIKILA